MTPAACTCDHTPPAHYVWDGCSADGCGCRYRHRPAGSDAARQAAMTAIRHTISETRRRRQETSGG